MMTSASVEIAKSQYGDAFYFFKRQGIFALVGLFVLFITLHIPIILWKKYSWVLLLSSFVLLILVLVPGVGKVVNGSARWIDLGFFSPSALRTCQNFYRYLSRFLLGREFKRG
jgi:cell division protein FtsW